MSGVVHFEFATPEPAREVEFFKSVFGWQIEALEDEEYWLIDTGEDAEGINGAILPMQSPEHPRTVDTIEVDDIDAALAKATAEGATVAMEKQEMPEVGWVAYLFSPTGIMFGVFQAEPEE